MSSINACGELAEHLPVDDQHLLQSSMSEGSERRESTDNLTVDLPPTYQRRGSNASFDALLSDGRSDLSLPLQKLISSKSSPQAPVQDTAEEYSPLYGMHWGVVTFCLCFGLFLAQVESSITATALVSIGSYFHNFNKATWVVLSYLLTYMGFSVIFAKLSDTVGRKLALISAWVLFAGFSLAAGLATSLNQLIVFRAFQGIGGSGLYSLNVTLLPQITPIDRWGFASTCVGVTIALGSIIGPILGGVIAEKSTWRWIYLFNAPCAAVGIVILALSWPKSDKKSLRDAKWGQIDYFGALFLFAAPVFLVYALQQGGAKVYAWDSSIIIAILTVSCCCWIIFAAWVGWLDSISDQRLRPIFPTSIALKLPSGPGLLVNFLTGFPYFLVLVNLPERFQIVNLDSPISAGLRMVPLLVGTALGSAIGGSTSKKRNLTSHTLIVGSCLTLLGCGLLSTIAETETIQAAQYGYQFIFGLGSGMEFTALVLMFSFAVDSEKVAASQGALNQCRVLGGTIGLTVATITFNKNLLQQLGGTLTPTELSNLQQSLNSILTLSPTERTAVARVFAVSFNDILRICTYLAALGVVMALCTFSRNPPSVDDKRQKQMELVERQLQTYGGARAVREHRLDRERDSEEAGQPSTQKLGLDAQWANLPLNFTSFSVTLPRYDTLHDWSDTA